MTALKSLMLHSTSSSHQTKPLLSGKLSLSIAPGCTQTIMPSSLLMPTSNCRQLTLSNTTHISADVDSAVKEQPIPRQLIVKRRMVYPHLKKHLPSNKSSPFTKNSNLSISRLKPCGTKFDRSGAVKPTSSPPVKDKPRLPKGTLPITREDKDPQPLPFDKAFHLELTHMQSDPEKIKKAWADYLNWNKIRRLH